MKLKTFTIKSAFYNFEVIVPNNYSYDAITFFLTENCKVDHA
jgi:hypothetical protein